MLKEASKGVVSFGGRFLEKLMTERKILESYHNIDYRIGTRGQLGINTGV